MNAVPDFFAYRSGATCVHRTNAAAKLVLLAVLTTLVFSGSVALLAVSSLCITAAALLARIPAANYRRIFVWIFWYALFILVFTAGTPYGAAPEIGIRSANGLFSVRLVRSISELAFAFFERNGLYLLRLAAALLAGTVFYETTGTLAIRDALDTMLSPAARAIDRMRRKDRSGAPRMNARSIAFQLTLTIIFIPRVFASWTALNRAWDARGGKAGKHELRQIWRRHVWRRLTALVPALIMLLLESARDTARAMENRSRS